MKAALITAMLAVAGNPNTDTIDVLEIEHQKPMALGESTITVRTLKPVGALYGKVAEPKIVKSNPGNDLLSEQLQVRQSWFETFGASDRSLEPVSLNYQSTEHALEHQQLLIRKNWHLELKHQNAAAPAN